MLAVYYTLTKLCHEMKNITIKVMSDNTTCVAYISNMGGKIVTCNEIARKIWEWAIERNIWLVCSHIPGKENTEADKLSRVLNENTEWAMSQNVFDRIRLIFPEIDINLFASHLNNKLDKYVSWFSDPDATHCDAFTMDWSKLNAYAFPPFGLVGNVLRKVQTDHADLIIVVPDWKSQYWFSKMLSMVTSDIFLLPRGREVCFNPVNRRAVKIRANFFVCRVSGSRTRVQDYHKQLPEPSLHHGEHKLENSIVHTLHNGESFVWKGKLIPCRDL